MLSGAQMSNEHKYWWLADRIESYGNGVLEKMTKSKRKTQQLLIRDRYTGNPLTEKEWIEAVKEAEETDYRKTAFRNGLGRFLKSKGFLVFALLIFPPLALLSGCAYNYKSNTSVSGESGSVNAGVSSSDG